MNSFFGYFSLNDKEFGDATLVEALRKTHKNIQADLPYNPTHRLVTKGFHNPPNR